jgi:hypothetical protein
MKLLRFGQPGSELPGILDDHGVIRSLEGVIDDVAGEALSESSFEKLRAIDPSTLPTVDPATRLGPCV